MNGLELKELRKKHTLTQKQLAEKLDVGLRAVQSWEYGSRNISKANVFRIRELFSDYAQGSFINEQGSAEYSVKNHDSQIKVINKYTQSTYHQYHEDPDFYKTLPQLSFNIEEGNYLAFEVVGGSMDDGTSKSYLEGDKLLCKEVENKDWKNIVDREFIIVHRTKGVLIRRISNNDVINKVLLLHSFNSLNEDIEVDIDDVLQIFKIIQILREPIR